MNKDLPSVEVMSGQAYLVTRGLRLLAIVGTVKNVPEVAADLRQILYEIAVESAASQASVLIPFLAQSPNINRVEIGHASHGWVVGVYERLLRSTVPEQMVSSVMGLLLG